MTVGAGQDDQTQFYGPVLDIAVAANATGDAAVIDSEVAEPGDAARAHAHFASDMQSTPVPPLAPSSVSAISIAAAVVVTWSANEDASGFLVSDADFGTSLAFAPAGATRVTIAPGHRRIQVRAYNAGGVSAPSAAVTVAPEGRHRAAGRK